MRYPISAENNLPASESRYPSTTQLRRLFNSSLDIICSINQERKFVHISESCQRILGYTSEEMVGRFVLDFVYEEDRVKSREIGNLIIEGEDQINFENRYFHKNGSLVTINWSCHWDTTELLMFCIGRDVTENKEKAAMQAQFEQKVKKQNREMSEMLERMTDSFFAMDDEWRIIYANSQCERTLNLNKEDYLSRNLWECFPDMVNTVYYEQYQKAMQQKVSVHFNAYLATFDRWLEVNAYPSATGLSVFFRDISKQKEYEQEILLSNERFRLAGKNNAIYDWDLATNNLSWGEGLADLFGYTSDELQMEQWVEALHPSERENLLIDLNQALEDKSNDVWKQEYQIRKKDGSYCYTFERGFIIRDGEGKAIRMVGMMQDISERKKTEVELQKLSLIAKETANAVLITDQYHKILWVNNAFTRMVGYSLEEAIGKFPGDLLDCPETDRRTIAYMQEQQRLGKSFQAEVQNRTKDNGRIWWEVYFQPVYSENGELAYYFSISTNISERKKLEKELDEQRKKMTSAIIAAQEKERATISQELHDSINPTLTAVKLYQDIILSDPEAIEQLAIKSKQLLQESISEIRRLSKRLSPPTLEFYSLSESIEELVDTIAATNQFKVTLYTGAIEGLKVVEEVHLALYRILQEQFTNILKYAEACEVEISFALVNGIVSMKIADDGKGFNLHQKRNGIGITNMTMRAESLNGKLSIESAPGKGCLLVASFPIC